MGRVATFLFTWFQQWPPNASVPRERTFFATLFGFLAGGQLFPRRLDLRLQAWVTEYEEHLEAKVRTGPQQRQNASSARFPQPISYLCRNLGLGLIHLLELPAQRRKRIGFLEFFGHRAHRRRPPCTVLLENIQSTHG